MPDNTATNSATRLSELIHSKEDFYKYFYDTEILPYTVGFAGISPERKLTATELQFIAEYVVRRLSSESEDVNDRLDEVLGSTSSMLQDIRRALQIANAAQSTADRALQIAQSALEANQNAANMGQGNTYRDVYLVGNTGVAPDMSGVSVGDAITGTNSNVVTTTTNGASVTIMTDEDDDNLDIQTGNTTITGSGTTTTVGGTEMNNGVINGVNINYTEPTYCNSNSNNNTTTNNLASSTGGGDA